jgi:transmembrane sensor
MNQEEAGQLLDKYLQGKASQREEVIVQSWLMNQASSNHSDRGEVEYPFPAEIWDAVYKSIHTKRNRLWPRIIAVAAAVALIVLGVWFFSAPRHPEFISGSPLANDIAPGKNTATLTLANGKTIMLSDAKTGVVVGDDLKYSDGSKIIDPSLPTRGISPGGRESNNQMLTASTPRGGTYIVTLPDGTKVWLNADSKLEFPSKFGKNEQRIVRLSGEGYFEVAKVVAPATGEIASARNGRPRNDVRVPFIVVTDKQEVTVLGTHFNINAYRDESNTRTTLLEGSVRVSEVAAPAAGEIATARGGRPRNDVVGGNVILKPNQQAVVSGYDRIEVKAVDVNTVVDWKNGEFIFNDEPLESIMRKVGRWYDVEVIYKDVNPKELFYGSVSRYDQVSKILSKLEVTGGIHFKLEGRKIFVSK